MSLPQFAVGVVKLKKNHPSLTAAPDNTSKMSLSSLGPLSRGPALGLLAVLSVCLVLNLGALLFSFGILRRGAQSYSAQNIPALLLQ